MAGQNVSSVKILADNSGQTRIPPSYVFPTTSTDDHARPMIILQDDVRGSEESIPVIDYSLLTTTDPEQRSWLVEDLGRACQEWGFFMVINHGVDERVMKRMLEECREFFDLSEEEKRKYEGKRYLESIRYGTGINASVEEVLFWRDYLKVIVHPEFHSPNKPAGFRQVLDEYTKAVRGVVRGLLGGISESLGLESCHIDKALDLESSLQVLAANLYPPCPQPDQALGLPPHSDHGLLTMLVQNGISGLQIQHKGKWIDVNAPPGAFLVNTGDHIEILSNGKYKSVFHRAVVNSKFTRISIAVSNGPSPTSIVSPFPELLENGSSPAAYKGMKYEEYLELQQSN